MLFRSDGGVDLATVHAGVAETENVKDKYALGEFDDHDLHIDAHVKYLLSERPLGKRAERLKAHIREHEAARAAVSATGGENEKIEM